MVETNFVVLVRAVRVITICWSVSSFCEGRGTQKPPPFPLTWQLLEETCLSQPAERVVMVTLRTRVEWVDSLSGCGRPSIQPD
jgi:hypothetical protein